MPRTLVETLHAFMTNNLVILAVAIILFLLVITLVDPGEGNAVMSGFWA
jgi:hypothetical protein